MVSRDAPQPVSLTRRAMLRILDALDLCDQEGAWSLYLPAEAAIDGVGDDCHAAIERLRSPTGSVVFWGTDARLVVAPPFPVRDRRRHGGFRTAELRALLTEPRTLGVILLRLGGYSVGLYRDGVFVEAKTGGRFVKNRHRKGGQSQRRFERIREGQIREHFDDVGEVVRARLLPHAAEIDSVVLGGDRRTIQAWIARSPLPGPLANKLLPRVLDVPEPRRDVLERTPAEIWTSRAIILRAPARDV
jgi:hypothetical protein